MLLGAIMLKFCDMNEDQKEMKSRQAQAEAKRFEIWIWFLHLLAMVLLGLAFFPFVYFLVTVWKACGGLASGLRILVFSFSIGFGYFLFGTTLLVLCILARRIFRFQIAPGLYGIHSKECLNWMGYNSLILLANAAFLDVLRISPFQTFFYREMGAKIGKGANVNTGGLADLAMLEIGDNVLIGGGVALICHASERGFLKLASTKIGNNVSIGLGSVIMPGCQLGDGVSIAPCSFLPKGTVVPPKGLWGGNPARDLRAERRQEREKNAESVSEAL